MNRVFINDSLDCMLEAAYIKKVDIISPFIGALIDRTCTESDTCPITAVFTEFVDVMNQVYDHNGRKIWTTSDITKLSRDKHNLKLIGLLLSSAYQKSGM